jgi:hypothetical protein
MSGSLGRPKGALKAVARVRIPLGLHLEPPGIRGFGHFPTPLMIVLSTSDAPVVAVEFLIAPAQQAVELRRVLIIRIVAICRRV